MVYSGRHQIIYQLDANMERFKVAIQIIVVLTVS